MEVSLKVIASLILSKMSVIRKAALAVIPLMRMKIVNFCAPNCAHDHDVNCMPYCNTEANGKFAVSGK